MTQPINLQRISIGKLETDQDIAQLVQHLRNLYNSSPIVTMGEGSPIVSPTKIGAEYLDTKNKKVYKATGNSKISDWQVLN